MSDTIDGLDALLAVVSVREIASYIERTAKWVSPETFNLLPVWYPEHSRKSHFYKGKWSNPQMNQNRTNGLVVHKVEGNIHANKALTMALGLRKGDRPNWSCCHIWGIDDASYQLSNTVVMDNRFFSCIGNMVLLPVPLKAFTDAMPAIKAMLRICASNLYGWECDHDDLATANEALKQWDGWDAYPKSWPRSPREKLPLGTVPLSVKIENDAKRRMAAIKHDLDNAGEFYPREQVKAALSYWNVLL